MPIYVFACEECGAAAELLLPLGETGPRPCETCGATMRHRFGRVAVKYQGWGFTSNDRLLPDNRPRSDFRALRERAERISDGGN